MDVVNFIVEDLSLIHISKEDVKALSQKAIEDLGELPGTNEFLEQLILSLIHI